jgi:lysophospholipase L1-like esterase
MFGRAACLVGVTVVIGGCGGSSNEKQPGATATKGASRSLVALGDSIASTASPACGCKAFAALFAARIGARLSDEAVPGSDARELLTQVKTDRFVRPILRTADAIVISMGTNDLPWRRPDDPCSVARQVDVIRWAGVDQTCIRRVTREFETSMDAVLTQIDRLRANRPPMLRLTTVYNSVIGDTADRSLGSARAVRPSEAAVARFDAIQCRLAVKHHGRCVDVQRAFNGRDGSQPAGRFLAGDYLHPNARGQQIIADLLYTTR